MHWNVAGNTVAPYFSIGAGRLKTKFDVDGVPGSSPQKAPVRIARLGFGFSVEEDKNRWDVEISRELQVLRRTIDLRETSEYSESWVNQWKLKATYTFSP